PNKVHGERGCGKHSSNPSGSRSTFVSPSTHLFQRGFSIKRLRKGEER
ncbi:TPA: NifB/NifX family molybdenum-iron cluster-binding protein, partial [Vibrio cholerae]